MEAESAVRIFKRSKEKKFRYEYFVTDGESSSFTAAKALSGGSGPYDNLEVKKLRVHQPCTQEVGRKTYRAEGRREGRCAK